MIVQALLNNALKFEHDNAVVAQGKSVTYAQLATQATMMAKNLVRLGVSRGDVIAIYSDRGINTVISMFAVMLSGAAYTIVEMTEKRIECVTHTKNIEPDFVLADAKEAAIFSDVVPCFIFEELTRATSDDITLPELTQEDVAYVLYTSGSTGKPKGVKVSHGNIEHYTQSIATLTQVPEGLNYGHLSTLAADLGNTSLFLSLYKAGSLHLIDQYTRKDPIKLFEYFVANRIEFVKITPSHWSAVSDAHQLSGNPFPHLEYLVFGGEPLLKTVVEKVLNSNTVSNVFNHYGPTETTVGVAALRLESLEHVSHIPGDVIPIGAPFGETTFYILDEQGHYRSSSVKGELLIAGPSVSKGYRNLPEENANRFITIELNDGRAVRCYKTGDYVDIDEDGITSFIGRLDRQVKINGYRVELESIENTMRDNLPIFGASVAYFELNQKKWLVAAITPPSEPCADMKARLEDVMPGYMVPQRIYVLENFPRNENGKTDVKAIKAILTEKLTEELANQANSSDTPSIEQDYDGVALEVYLGVQPIFHKYIAKTEYTIHDSFFELGGNSLDSVQLVANLQYKGLSLSAFDFNNTPTIDGIVKSVVKNRESANKAGNVVERTEVTAFAAAQDFFFKEELASPDLYNQALMFRIDQRVDFDVLKQAMGILCEQHELLRTSFARQEGHYVAKPLNASIDSLLSRSTLPANEDHRTLIKAQSTAVQAAINLASGEVFKAHLFETTDAESYLLLVAHHISVDVISWRIITSELSQLYGDLIDGIDIVSNPVRCSFWDWVDHLDSSIAKDTSSSVSADPKPSVFASKMPHTEGNAHTFWFAYSKEHSIELEAASAAKNVPLHTLLLGTLAHEYGKLNNANRVCIDVESHGRVSFDPEVDISRVVGWHTSTYPFEVDVDAYVIDQTLLNTKKEFDSAVNLGVEKSWQVKHIEDVETLYHAPICFNYLGDTDFPHDDRLALTPSTMDIGPCRGRDNIRFHDIKVSIQKMHGQYVVDISYPSVCDETQKAQIVALLERYRDRLNSLLVDQSAVMAPVLTEGTSTGAIHYCPEGFISASESMHQRHYGTVLLTGASGFIGVHCLKELLDTTSAEIVCLVRSSADKSAAERLYENWCWYFSDEDWQTYASRIAVLESDLTRTQFGLRDEQYEGLKNVVDAIYHLAADTRLIGSTQEFYESNIVPLKQIINFSKVGKVKDLHYMSTLAVCGVNRDMVKFRESSLNIGQDFQNGYEKTKYQAEELVNSHIVEGYRAYIYRTGNVSGNSVTGKFQRNSKANRLIQFLNATAKVGVLPTSIDEEVNLSPVDVVAAFVVKLSLDHEQAPGVFHVDTPHYFSMKALYKALANNGFTLNHSTNKTFGDVFGWLDSTVDSDFALGKLWSSRSPRNVIYDHSVTLRKLDKLGCRFEEPTEAWIEKFICHLIEQKAISKSDPDLLHLGQFTRKRIFKNPDYPSVLLKASA
ncbi:AMP-binding protein [Pseudoalteromonas xiamenensis]